MLQTQPTQQIRLYWHPLSGHSHRAELFLSLLGLPFDRAQAIANNLFQLMETHLKQRKFLVGESPTIADIAGYSYIAHAPEGDISLEPYPHIRAWLTRITELPGFVPMVKTAVGLAA